MVIGRKGTYKSAEYNQACRNTRQAAIDEKRSGAWRSLTGTSINFYWLDANQEIECLLYSFYTRIARFPREGEWKEKACLLSSGFGEVEAVIKEYKKGGGTDTASIASLQATLYLLTGKTEKALTLLKDSVPDEVTWYSTSCG